MKSAVSATFLLLLSTVACTRTDSPLNTDSPSHTAIPGPNTPKIGPTTDSLVQIANADSPSRVVRDAQGNVVELDLIGLGISDAFAVDLKLPELSSLQKLSVSGEWITPHFFDRLVLFDNPPLRELVLVDTAVPPDHEWVDKFRRKFNTTSLTFLGPER